MLSHSGYRYRLFLFRRESYICRYQRPQVTCPGFSAKQAGRPTGSSDLLSGKQAIYSFRRFHQKYPEPLQRESRHPHRAFSPGSRLHQPGQGSFAQTLAEQIIKKTQKRYFGSHLPFLCLSHNYSDSFPSVFFTSVSTALPSASCKMITPFSPAAKLLT